ncbi:polysaccharide pyruvyl transferase family protein [Oribacterium sp. FC2011]|uniref:polysaccharide pyruvyl transferase family protein n=1 Tax=Oribacterium sp. FC2011 TaxID=1408311 RepID=UPI000A752913|nr:polysaccharide pyruvyl transferase family protein [Oribacterium sp. FC2011]
MSYQSIRNNIMKNETLFKIIRFFYTPFRVSKEFIARRKMADSIIDANIDMNQQTKKIFYFGVPEHNNLGDIAQTYCTRRWLSENYPEYRVIEGRTRVSFDKKMNDYMKSVISENDIIFFQSGYCTRHNNPDHLMHLHIAKKFPGTKLVVLPQTVKLNDKRDISITKNIFTHCKRLLFITRDSKSREYAKSFVDDERLECFPDIVTSLIGRVPINEKRQGAMLCVRNDDEKFYSDDELITLLGRLKDVYGTVVRTDTNSNKSADEVFHDLQNEILEKVKEFARYECIITDRYHGTIFSLIANTPVIVIKTNDHKVTTALEWFENRFDRHAVQLAQNLDEAYSLALELKMTVPHISNSDSIYIEYYEHKLKMLVDKI